MIDIKVANWFGLLVIVVLGLHQHLVPSIQAGYRRPDRKINPRALSDDPTIGTEMELGVRKAVPGIFIIFDDCTSCTLGLIESVQKNIKTESITYLFQGNLPENARSLIHNKWPASVMHALPQPIVRSWNPYFTPRVYALNSRGELIYLQSHTEAFLDSLLGARLALSKHVH